jgi:SAM-dependent methyltransferase
MSQVGHFDRVAGRYDELRSPPDVTPVHDLLVREGDLAGRRVLDVGCGTGAHGAILAERFGCKVAGLDSSRAMLAKAREKLPGAELKLGVAEELPFEAESFDAVLAMLVVQHLDRARSFREARRVLVPGGRCLITTSNPAAFPRFWMAPLFPSYVAVEQARFPSAEALEADLRAAGFVDVRCLRHDVPRRFSRDEALARLHGRHASTFELLGEEEYRQGLERAERVLPDPVEYTLELLIVKAVR